MKVSIETYFIPILMVLALVLIIGMPVSAVFGHVNPLLLLLFGLSMLFEAFYLMYKVVEVSEYDSDTQRQMINLKEVFTKDFIIGVENRPLIAYVMLVCALPLYLIIFPVYTFLWWAAGKVFNGLFKILMSPVPKFLKPKEQGGV